MKKKIALLAAALTLLLSGCSTGKQTTPTTTPGMTTPAVPTPKTNASSATTPAATSAASGPTLPGALGNAGEAGDMTIKVYLTDEKKIVEMPVEEYLYGVVAGEMRKDWPEEALKAQAVVARTFLLYFLSNHDGSMYEGADISTDVSESQAYDAKGVDDAVRKAVDDTRGQALTYDNEYIIAWFHSNAGGKTATATEGLDYKEGNPAYIQVVDSPDLDAPKEFVTWEAAFEESQVTAALKEMGITAKLTSASIAKRGPSGRCVEMEIGGQLVSCPQLRTALDPTVFRSTQLTSVSLEDGSLILAGKGFGHGVGMSQWGAYAMAQEGAGYDEILAHYYVDTELVEAWK
jgi:stage II sporulation protein D